MGVVPFASLFKKINIQVDRKGKFETTTDTYEWVKSSTDPQDTNAVAFQVIIPNSDNGKPFNARISMERVFNSMIPRFEVSDKLLTLFPNILLMQNRSVTEEEIMLYIWTYIQDKNLLEGRDNRRSVRCDSVLCALLNLDIASNPSIPVQTMKQRLFDESLALLIPAAPPSKAVGSAATAVAMGPEGLGGTVLSPPAVDIVGSGKINLEYYLTSSYNTTIDATKDGSCGPSAISKNGGKCFDLEVYLPTSSLESGSSATGGAGAFRVDGLAHLNRASASEMAREVHLRLDAHYQRCLYMTKQINAVHNQQTRLRRLQKERMLYSIMQGHARGEAVAAGGRTKALGPNYLSRDGSGLLGLVPQAESNDRCTGLTDDVLVRCMQSSATATSLLDAKQRTSILHTLGEFFDVGSAKQCISLAAPLQTSTKSASGEASTEDRV